MHAEYVHIAWLHPADPTARSGDNSDVSGQIETNLIFDRSTFHHNTEKVLRLGSFTYIQRSSSSSPHNQLLRWSSSRGEYSAILPIMHATLLIIPIESCVLPFLNAFYRLAATTQASTNMLTAPAWPQDHRPSYPFIIRLYPTRVTSTAVGRYMDLTASYY